MFPVKPTGEMSLDEPRSKPAHIPPLVVPLLHVALGLLTTLLVATFLIAARKRILYPYSFDWIEDGVLATVSHLQSGLPLYAAPDSRFTAYIYTPLYYYVSLFVSHFTGLSYVPTRLVSLVSTLGCFAAIYALVYREGKRHFAALAAVGCFAACHPALRWFDRGRVDMLALLFFLWALYATRRSHPILAGLLWTCAFQSKQGILPIALLMLCHDWPRPRQVVIGIASFLISLGASIAVCSYATHGWYNLYVFGLHGSLPFESYQAKHFLNEDVLSVYPIAILTAVAALLIVPSSWRNRATAFYLGGSVALFCITGFIRAHRGASVNALLPLYAWIAIVFGIALARLAKMLAENQGRYARAALCFLLFAASLELLRFEITPSGLLPKPIELAKRNSFEAQLAMIPGPVLVPGHPEYAARAGKPLYASTEATGAIIDSTNHLQADRLMKEYKQLIESSSWNAVALDDPPQTYWESASVWLPRDFLTFYPLRVNIADFENKTSEAQPRWFYMPCSQVEVARRLQPDVDTRACPTKAAPLT